MTLSTHVLDTAKGLPAQGVNVQVEHIDGTGEWTYVGSRATGADGRTGDLVDAAQWKPGLWRLVFDTDSYLGPHAFYPCVSIELRVTTNDHHHIPLLLSPFGYSTYRGS